jgi:arsenate reductase (glutaredoxin)
VAATAPLVIQLYGTKKCADSRKAERFFKERGATAGKGGGIKLHLIDLGEKAMSAGELRNVAAKLVGTAGGMDALIDRGGKRYLERGLKYSAPTGPRIEQMLVDDPLLLRTPIVRCAAGATVGYAPDVWTAWLAAP